MVDKLEYLKIIQDVITRMANNSFSLKGWCITIASGIFGINLWRDSEWEKYLLVLVPVLMFWILDTYYLRQERLYRGLYDRVRMMSEKELNANMYSMIPPRKGDQDFNKKKYSFMRVMFSITELGLYFILLIVLIIVLVFMFRNGALQESMYNAET